MRTGAFKVDGSAGMAAVPDEAIPRPAFLTCCNGSHRSSRSTRRRVAERHDLHGTAAGAGNQVHDREQRRGGELAGDLVVGQGAAAGTHELPPPVDDRAARSRTTSCQGTAWGPRTSTCCATSSAPRRVTIIAAWSE